MGRKHNSTVAQPTCASTKERIGSKGNSEIDKQKEKLVSWYEVVKVGKRADHSHEKSHEWCEVKVRIEKNNE